MLVLTRHVNEDVVIGGNIVVRVAAIRGDKVRLAIDAPREISVHRKEVQDQIKRDEEKCSVKFRDAR